MAFRPAPNLIEGVLDNTHPGSVRGWMDFYRHGRGPRHCVRDFDGVFREDCAGIQQSPSLPKPSQERDFGWVRFFHTAFSLLGTKNCYC